jgi:hypothetical protein
MSELYGEVEIIPWDDNRFHVVIFDTGDGQSALLDRTGLQELGQQITETLDNHTIIRRKILTETKTPRSGRVYLNMARREMNILVGAVEEIEQMLHDHEGVDTESILFLLDHLQGELAKIRSYTQNYQDKKGEEDEGNTQV